MWVICRRADSNYLRTAGHKKIIFDTEDSALDYLHKCNDNKVWTVRKFGQDDYKRWHWKGEFSRDFVNGDSLTANC